MVLDPGNAASLLGQCGTFKTCSFSASLLGTLICAMVRLTDSCRSCIPLHFKDNALFRL